MLKVEINKKIDNLICEFGACQGVCSLGKQQNLALAKYFEMLYHGKLEIWQQNSTDDNNLQKCKQNFCDLCKE